MKLRLATLLALLGLFLVPSLATADVFVVDPDEDGVPSASCVAQPDFCSPQPPVCNEEEVCIPQPDICMPMPDQCAPLPAPAGDNCVDVANVGQEDADADNIGDACDETPNAESILQVVVLVINDGGGTLTPSETSVHVALVEHPSQETLGEGFFSHIAKLFFIEKARADDAPLFAPASFPGNASGTDVIFNTEHRDYVITVDPVQRYIIGMEGCPNATLAPNVVATCTIVLDDNYGFGNGFGDYPALPTHKDGCTDPLAKNFRTDSTRNDGSCYYASSTGSVLGASTNVPDLPLPAGCSPYLKAYLKQGRKNDAEEVKKLQTMLNESIGAKLPVTGYFGNLTKSWVKMYQKKFEGEILKPWIDAGYAEKGGQIAASGYAFITTRRHINIAKCEELKKEPMPVLVPDVNP